MSEVLCTRCGQTFELGDTDAHGLPLENQQLRSEVERLRLCLTNLRSYVACEGYSDNEGTRVVGLAYEGSIWGPVCQPNIQPYELAEAVEKWLHDKIDSALNAKGTDK